MFSRIPRETDQSLHCVPQFRPHHVAGVHLVAGAWFGIFLYAEHGLAIAAMIDPTEREQFRQPANNFDEPNDIKGRRNEAVAL